MSLSLKFVVVLRSFPQPAGFVIPFQVDDFKKFCDSSVIFFQFCDFNLYNVSVKSSHRELFDIPYLLFHQSLILFIPFAPKIVSPPYWAVLASPKNITHSVPFNAADIGSAICAKEII